MTGAPEDDHAAGMIMVPPPHGPEEIVRRLREGMSELPFYWQPQIPLTPVVMAGAAYDEIVRAAQALTDLLKRAVWSLGDTPVERNRRLGMSEEFEPLYGAPEYEHAYADWQYRPDVLLTAEGPRFIEFNVSAATGGMPHTHALQRTWLDIYADAGLRCSSPFAARTAALERLCARLGLERSVAILREPRPDPAEQAVYDTQVSHLLRHGFKAEHLLVDDLAVRAAENGRFGIVLKQFVALDRLHDGSGLEAVVGARDGGALTLAPHSSYQLANKQMLALLSQGLPWMSSHERELVRRYVPWSRLVRDGPVDYRGSTRATVGLLAAEQESFVLKNGVGDSGRQVVIGRLTQPAQWVDACAQAIDEGTWIVQEYHESLSMPMRLWDVASESVVETALSGVISPYVVDSQDGGCMVRYDLADAKGLVTIAQSTVRFNTLVVTPRR